MDKVIELTHEEEYRVKKMYNNALEQYNNTNKSDVWESYIDGIIDVLNEIGIKIEGITN